MELSKNKNFNIYNKSIIVIQIVIKFIKKEYTCLLHHLVIFNMILGIS